jgi:hypothetical protein
LGVVIIFDKGKMPARNVAGRVAKANKDKAEKDKAKQESKNHAFSNDGDIQDIQ